MRIRLVLPARDGGRSQSGLVDSWAGGSSGHRGVVRQSIHRLQQLADAGRERSGVGHARALDAPQRQAGGRRHPADSRLGAARHRTRRTRSGRADRVHRLAGRAWNTLTQMAIGQASGSSSTTTTRWSSVPRSQAMRLRSPPCATSSLGGVRVFHSGMVDLHLGTRQATGTEDAPLGCGAGVVRAGTRRVRIWSPTEISPATWECRPIGGLLRRRRSDRAR